MWRKLSFLLLAFAFCVVPVLAAENFTTELITRQEVVLPGESAEFSLDITNELAVSDRYSIAVQDASFILFIDPRPTAIGPDQTARFGLEVSPRSFVTTGTKVVPIRVRSLETGEQEIVDTLIVLRDADDLPVGVYVPSIALSVDAQESIDPRDDVVMNIHLRNRNARVYDAQDPLTISIMGELFQQTFTTQLGGVGDAGERSPERRIDIDSMTPPGEYPYVVSVIVDNRTFSQVDKTIVVEPYTTVEVEEFVDSSLFKTTTTYRLINFGNVDTTGEVVVPASPVSRLFISSSNNYVADERDGDDVIVVAFPLSPGEEQTVTVTENYRLLALLFLLMIVSIVGYFLLRSPIVLDKEAFIAGSGKEGSSDIKVQVMVKNRSSKTMRNLRVIDKASEVAQVVAGDGLGTLKPSKVSKKKGQGTLMRWDLDSLEPYEERIISYKLRMPLTLVGELSLPSVKVRFDLSSGRERSTHSNEATVTRR